MSILAVQQELVKDEVLEDYPAFVRRMDRKTFLVVFGVRPGETRFRCPTNGQTYDDLNPLVVDGSVWTKCSWCDRYRNIRGIDSGYQASEPQPHCNPLIGDDDE